MRRDSTFANPDWRHLRVLQVHHVRRPQVFAHGSSPWRLSRLCGRHTGGADCLVSILCGEEATETLCELSLRADALAELIGRDGESAKERRARLCGSSRRWSTGFVFGARFETAQATINGPVWVLMGRERRHNTGRRRLWRRKEALRRVLVCAVENVNWVEGGPIVLGGINHVFVEYARLLDAGDRYICRSDRGKELLRGGRVVAGSSALPEAESGARRGSALKLRLRVEICEGLWGFRW